jgi:hypothetical protein
MDEKKTREEHERLKKREKMAVAASVGILLVGALIVILVLVSGPTYLTMMDTDHLTDDGISVRDLENATYTWTADEIKEKHDAQGKILLVGNVIVAIGIVAFYTTALINPANTTKNAHKIYCDGSGEKKYCPECGLKLSELDSK